ncbi:hypothetical protein M876_02375 [Elizabethkingia anophelis FMS-007]|nr:hypothetical protein M876_02375 [Elizabethkingia anophelis FMS-007]
MPKAAALKTKNKTNNNKLCETLFFIAAKMLFYFLTSYSNKKDRKKIIFLIFNYKNSKRDT